MNNSYYKRKYPKPTEKRIEKQIRLHDDEWSLVKRLATVLKKGGAEKCRQIMKNHCLIWATEGTKQIVVES